MACTCVIGLQWGDEAKGKIVDLLTDRHDIVVRFQGGANAGHTVEADGITYKLSLLPTGILHPGLECVIGCGVVINLPSLIREIVAIRDQGIAVGPNLIISDRAHMIMPWHLREEQIHEASGNGAASLGTTMRGIGPCYRDKAGRIHALRIMDLYQPDHFRARVEQVAADKNRILQALRPDRPPLDPPAIAAEFLTTNHTNAHEFGGPLDPRAIAAEFLGYAETVRPHVADATTFLHRALDAGKRILFEGAQGSLLDVDHGTFPYVTSSNSSMCGLSSGCGVSARKVDRVIGVLKAYTTRVGAGPFPTEMDPELSAQVRGRSGRAGWGVVTGRARRCGWLDAVASRYTAAINGIDALAVTLLDVLSGQAEIPVAMAYDYRGERLDHFPSDSAVLAECRPVYRSFPGWNEDIRGARKLAHLPRAARHYLDAVAQVLGAPVEIVSVGPDRAQTILD